MKSDVWGSISDQGIVTHITGSNFAQNSITINGWLHHFLWAQASQEKRCNFRMMTCLRSWLKTFFSQYEPNQRVDEVPQTCLELVSRDDNEKEVKRSSIERVSKIRSKLDFHR
ncbi:hypothetical protein Fmac_011056 [Flemingia macrophylla]|uniref:Uncharacterized protein n=1 Tax=Flemingia macrophylla TaxID=520843 RepID=A0ABD1MLC9_9FABA